MNIHKLLQRLQEFDADAAQQLEKEWNSKTKEINDLHNKLDLLERAIAADYDSILITELNLENPGPRIVYVNKGFEKLTGYKAKEVIGKTPRILQGPKTDRATLDRLKQNLIEGQSFFGQTVNYRKDGSEFINQWDIHPLENDKGEITHWVSYQHDVTERKNAEFNMGFDPATEYDKLDELGKSIIVDFDQQANIVYANKAFREMSGYQMDSLKTKKAYDILLEGSPKLNASFFESADDSKITSNYTLVQASGKEITVKVEASWLSVDGQPLFRTRITNLSLQSRVLDAITKIKSASDLKTNGTDNHPYRLILKKSDNNFVVENISPAFEERFGTWPKGTQIQHIDIPGVEKTEELQSWASQASNGHSVCENLKVEDEELTLYVKPLEHEQIMLYISPAYKVQI